MTPRGTFLISLLWLAGAAFVTRLYYVIIAGSYTHHASPEQGGCFLGPLFASAVLLASGLLSSDAEQKLFRSVLAGLMILVSFLLLFLLFLLDGLGASFSNWK